MTRGGYTVMVVSTKKSRSVWERAGYTETIIRASSRPHSDIGKNADAVRCELMILWCASEILVGGSVSGDTFLVYRSRDGFG